MALPIQFPSEGFNMLMPKMGGSPQASRTMGLEHDKVSISPEAKEKAERLKLGLENEGTKQASENSRIEYIEKRIRELKEKIREIQEDEKLPEKEKQQRIQALNQELMQLSEELVKQGGAGYARGTSAEGFGDSLT